MSAPLRSLAFQGSDLRSLGIVRAGGVTLATLALVAGSSSMMSASARAELPSDSTGLSDVDVNQSLDSMARLFADVVADPQIRQEVHDGVAERFDGDTNVLWDTLAAESDVRSALATAYREERSVQSIGALSTIDTLADSIPRLQVAVPVNFEDWDPAAEAPLVAYMPEGVDDLALKTITAYDATGEAHELDAQVPPSEPVIVLGLNERTDDSGNLLPTEQAQSGQVTTLASTYQVRLTKVYLHNDMEPWTKGAAEIKFKAKSAGNCGVDHIEPYFPLDHGGQTWSDLLDVGNTTCDVIWYWWEDDSGTFDFTLTYGGFNLGVQMADGDDLIGATRLPHSSFEGGTDRQTHWTALDMWTD